MRKGVKKFADALGRRNNGGASSAGGGGISGGAGGVMLGAGVDLPGAEGGAAEALTATSVSGGLGSGRAVDSKIPIADGFEKVHLARLKKTHALMEERIGLLQLHAHEVGSSVGGLALAASVACVTSSRQDLASLRATTAAAPRARATCHQLWWFRVDAVCLTSIRSRRTSRRRH